MKKKLKMVDTIFVHFQPDRLSLNGQMSFMAIYLLTNWMDAESKFYFIYMQRQVHTFMHVWLHTDKFMHD